MACRICSKSKYKSCDGLGCGRGCVPCEIEDPPAEKIAK